MAPGWGLVTGKNKPQLEAWNFQPTLRSLEKGEGLKMELVIHHSYMVKPP